MATLRHLGHSGLELELDGLRIAVDPPRPTTLPAVITWTEQERVLGVRGGAGPVAALPEVLAWLGRSGTALRDGEVVPFAGAGILATPYKPIPYATPTEALRKTRSGLRHPLRAASRLAFTLRRPQVPPLAVEVRWGGVRVVLLGQCLHRFLAEEELDRLVERHGGADIAIAGTDYDDERATGELLGRFDAGQCVVADLVGPVRRLLGLPTRSVSVAASAGPPGTRVLEEGGELRLEG